MIVHPDNELDMLTRDAVTEIFLKQKTLWRDGVVAEPVDLPADSPLREAFSRNVLGRGTEDVTSYWREEVASGGKAQPLVVDSDAEAVAHVRTNRGGIAYVSTSTPLEGVTLVLLVNAPKVISRVPPSYTEKALRFRVEGDVVLRVLVDEEGRADQVEVVKGLAFGLSEEAVRAVKQWRFEPANSDGFPIPIEIDITIKFNL